MRTFIAIPLPEACRSMLEQMQGELRRFGADVGWVAVPSIHITLKFLGEVDPSIIPMMAEALQAAAASTRSFDLQLHGLRVHAEVAGLLLTQSKGIQLLRAWRKQGDTYYGNGHQPEYVAGA